jgi:hypothetical protein
VHFVGLSYIYVVGLSDIYEVCVSDIFVVGVSDINSAYKIYKHKLPNIYYCKPAHHQA